MRKILLLTLFSIQTLFSASYAQELIKGEVYDDQENEPLIGVSVVVKGTGAGTVTDVDGKFSIQAVPGDKLEFRYIGYTMQEITVTKDMHSFTVRLVAESFALQEFVAVGYGTVRKSDLTGAVASVKGDMLVKMQSPNLASALVGLSPGVMITSPNGSIPGSSPTIIIRGENSITGTNDPLWVIDGFTRAGGATTVNPEDVESIEILKDASATAIYGSRGAGGVIVVTTKKGSNKNVKPFVEIKATNGIQLITNELDLMTGPENYDYWSHSAIANYFDSRINPEAHYDWRKEITRPARQQDYYLSVSGGSEYVNYKVNVNYFDQQGSFKYNDDYKRFTTRAFLDLKLNQYVYAGLNYYFERRWRNDGATRGNYQDAVETSPLIPIYNEDGSYNHSLNPRNLDIQSANFVERMRESISKSEGNVNNLQAYLTISPLKGLSLKSMFSLNYDTNKTQSFSPKRLDLVDRINSASASGRQTNAYEWINTLSYIRDFGKEHSINAVIGMTYESSERFTVSASGQDFPSDSFEYWAIGSGPRYELVQPEDPITAITPAMIMLRNSGSTSYYESALMSYLARINYVLKNKYLFTLTGRYDGASQLAAGHKWALFPSAAVGWRLGEEEFIKNLNIFDNLKVRASWGRTGSQGIDSYSTLGLATRGSVVLGDDNKYAPVYSFSDLPNPYLTWEKTSQTDIGLDVAVLNSRLRITADYYYKHTFDMFITKNLPAETGFGSYLTNDGEMENKGIELDIAGDVVRNSKFQLTTGVNFGLNRNKILYLGGVDEMRFTNKNSYGGLYSHNTVGRPISLIYGWQYDGIWQNEEDIKYGAVNVEAGASQTLPGDMRYKDLNNDGKIDDEDKVMILNPHPKFSAAWNGTVSYRNVTLSWLWQGLFGHQIYNYTKRQLYDVLAFRKNFWTPDSGIEDQPTAGNENVGDSDYFVEDGSFFKLRNVTLNYSFPQRTINNLGISRLDIYVTGSDLLTLTGYSGYNPEVSRNGNSESYRGIDYYSYPASLSVFAGIKITF